jgi:DNA polymerase-3 subunit beta
MDVMVNRDDLIRELEVVDRAVARKVTIPVLANVLVAAETNGTVMTAATDLDLSIRSWWRGRVSIAGTRTIPARKLGDVVKTLPTGADVRLASPLESSVEITSAGVRVSLQTLPAQDYPLLPATPETAPFIMARDRLKETLQRVRFVIPRGEADKRFYLAGALLEVADGRARVVATDGHRLALVEMAAQGQEQLREIIAGSAVEALPSVIDYGDGNDVAVRVGESHVFFDTPQRTLIARRSSGEFPKYVRIIPADREERLIVSRADLADCARRVLVVGDQQKAIFIASHAQLEVSAAGQDGVLIEKLAAQYGGVEMKIALNASYVAEFLDAAGTEQVSFETAGPDAPMQWRAVGDESYRYVLMPMRL